MGKFLFTSESVTEGHPDKACDAFSDAILDSILSQDNDAHVACESLATKDLVVISGEIRTDAKLNMMLNEIVEEGVLVASHEGILIDPKKVINQINALPYSLKTSLQRDVKSLRQSEFESITGGVLRLAESYGVPVPAHKYIYNLIRKKIFDLQKQNNGKN